MEAQPSKLGIQFMHMVCDANKTGTPISGDAPEMLEQIEFYYEEERLYYKEE